MIIKINALTRPAISRKVGQARKVRARISVCFMVPVTRFANAAKMILLERYERNASIQTTNNVLSVSETWSVQDGLSIQICLFLFAFLNNVIVVSI